MHSNTGSDFAPGVLEALEKAHGDDVADPAAAPVGVKAAPLFVDAATRSKSFPLDYPVIFDGREIRAIVLHRLTVAEVAAFMDRWLALEGKARDALYWPIYRLEDGTLAPTELLDGLDADDLDVLTKAADSFLPRRFRAAAAGGSTPQSGASTAP